jgi:protein phosphatase
VLELEQTKLNSEPGDSFLLCTDGLTKELSDTEIQRILAANEPQLACELLVQRALAHGGSDNVTVVLAVAGG